MAFTAINKCFQSKTWLLGRVSNPAAATQGERRMRGDGRRGKRQGAKTGPKPEDVAGLSRWIDLELKMALD
jgi:hypothetical protein